MELSLSRKDALDFIATVFAVVFAVFGTLLGAVYFGVYIENYPDVSLSILILAVAMFASAGVLLLYLINSIE